MKKNILIFLKGFLMGICDLIPGISGGTIAFITGIYARLINAVKGFSPKLVYDFFKFVILGGSKNWNKLKEDVKKLDLLFLLVLLLGIGSAFLVGSRIIKFLLENYFSYTMAFFIGFILASSKIIFENIQNHKLKNILFGFLGLGFGILLAVLIPAEVNTSMSYVFLGGFLGISAMFLPGISGAFILLIMGLYEFVINALHNISSQIDYILVFVAGAVLGAFIISRLISFLFKKDKCKTLYFLLGLVIGALSIPVKKIVSVSSFEIFDIFIMLIFLFGGILLVSRVNKYGKRHREKIISS